MEGHPYERAMLEGEAEVLRDDARQLADEMDRLEERRLEIFGRRVTTLTRLLRIEARLEALTTRRAS